MVTCFSKNRFCNQGTGELPVRFLSVILLCVIGILSGDIADSTCDAALFDDSVETSRSSSIGELSTGSLPPNASRPARLQSPIGNDDIEDIILRLGDPSYVVRKDAESELLKIGGPAIEPLIKVLSHHDSRQPDSEVLLRASRLLILIERAEHSRKIRDFLKGSNDDCGLPGWTQFSEIVGSDTAARKLFVGTHESQPKLMSTIEQGLNPAQETFQDVTKRSLRVSSNRNASQTLGTLCSVLFVSSFNFAPGPNQSATSIKYGDADLRRIRSLLEKPQMITFINSSGSKVQIYQLISHWLDSVTDDEAQPVNVKLSVISTYQLKNKLDSAFTILSRSTLPPKIKVTAMQVISQLGNRNHVPQLEMLFKDSTTVGKSLTRTDSPSPISDGVASRPTDQQLIEVRICDLALATAVVLRQEKLTDFGFISSASDGNKLVPDQAGFSSDQQRSTAFKKWHQKNSETAGDKVSVK